MSATPRTRALAFIALLATIVAGVYARGISVDAGVMSALPDGIPAVSAWRAALTRFDAMDVLLVGLEEPGSGISQEGLRHVDAVTRGLEAEKVGGVLAVRSVTNVATLREGEGGEVDSGLLVTALPQGPSAVEALRRRIDESAQVKGALVSADQRGYNLVVRVDPRKDPLAVAALVERTVEREKGALKAYYYGPPFFAAVPTRHILAHLPQIVLMAVVLLFGILIAGTRRPGRAVAVVVGALSSLAFGAALLRACGGSLSPGVAPLALGWLVVVGALLMTVGDGARAAAPGWPAARRVVTCVAVIVLGGVVASRARVLSRPGDLFSRDDEAGAAVAFYDERFGGADFLQIDFAGDLTNPAVAARLMRLSDLLAGTSGLSDVRSTAQVLAFVNHGFGDLFRIPSTRAALANLWFFLEGNGDVRSLVTDKRDEAMVQIRLRSRGGRDIAALTDDVTTAVTRSALVDGPATKQRLEAIARATGLGLDPSALGAVTVAAAGAPTPAEEAQIAGQVATRLRQVLAAPDSPYSPSDDEWSQLAAALAGDAAGVKARLAAAAASIPTLHAKGLDEKLADMLAQRARDARVAVRSQRLVERLLPASAHVPEGVRLRVEGALADLIDPQADGGAATITVTGFPVLAGAISARSLAHMGWGLAAALLVGCVLAPVGGVTAGVRRLVVAATAVALTFVVCRVAGVEADVGSTGIYVATAGVGVLTPASLRGPRSFVLAVGGAMTALLFTGVPPVTRLAATAAVGLVSVALVAWFVDPSASDAR